MQGPAMVSDHAIAAPAPGLARYVRRYIGYHYRDLPAGSHRGLPSPDLTVVLGLGAPTRLAAMPDPREPPADFAALVGGLHTRPAIIVYQGEVSGIEIDLRPRGARALLGLPAAELAGRVVSLDLLLGPEVGVMLERLRDAPTWPARFEILDRQLTRRLGRLGPAVTAVDHAWRLIVGSGGAIEIARVAGEVGWSRRHLDHCFRREYGLTPKQVARVARFHRSRELLRLTPTATLADAAASCGYCDQAHMAREWNALAGTPPSRWIATEDLPFVQDGEADPLASFSA